jgi:hypothetical protein
MGRDLGFFPVSAVKEAIGKWIPRECENEKSYENSLYLFLHEYFPDVQITKEYAIGRTKADINVGDEVIIEIKKDLKSTGQYGRLIGQLEEYIKWKGATIILLVGNTEPHLKKKILSRSAEGRLLTYAFHVIEKKEQE